jgi:hypothetical protein
VGPEVAGRDDLFFVYLVNQEDGSLIGPIWIHHHQDGLVTPDIPLFKQFKESIEAAMKMPTPKAPTPQFTVKKPIWMFRNLVSAVVVVQSLRSTNLA